MQKINPRILLAIILIPMGLIIAMVPEDMTGSRKVSTEQILQEIASGSQFVSPDEIAGMIVENNPVLQLIDVRSSNEFENFSLPGAVNIPLTAILSPEWRDILDQDVKINVFYSNGSVHANEAWILTRQQGYLNNYVLQGGLNYWMEAIANPDPPSDLSPDEEFARYDFRRAVNSALGGEAVERAAEAPPPPAMPAIRPRERTPVVQGGC
ncbi:MAG: rhodanese-like domain-containing protein [Marinilabiliales bacterium]|nr:MAG: rhodanese-like domain-containing protein [Marinilabiliales bacterium]